jgi:hypothetical protein
MRSSWPEEGHIAGINSMALEPVERLLIERIVRIKRKMPCEEVDAVLFERVDFRIESVSIDRSNICIMWEA